MRSIIYKNILRLFLSVLVIFLLAMTAVNYFVDGGFLFHRAKKFESTLAQAFLQQQKILICRNYNDRQVKKSFIEHLKQAPEVLIFGSSRSMPIREDLFRGLSFFNASVTGGTLEDDLALYYLFQKKGQHPKVVIISLDQWLI